MGKLIVKWIFNNTIVKRSLILSLSLFYIYMLIFFYNTDMKMFYYSISVLVAVPVILQLFAWNLRKYYLEQYGVDINKLTKKEKREFFNG